MAILLAVKTTIDIPDELYRQVKARCALLGKKIREVTVELYQKWLEEGSEWSEERAPERWLEEWLRLGEEALRGAPPGPTITEVLAAGRGRLERE